MVCPVANVAVVKIVEEEKYVSSVIAPGCSVFPIIDVYGDVLAAQVLIYLEPYLGVVAVNFRFSPPFVFARYDCTVWFCYADVTKIRLALGIEVNIASAVGSASIVNGDRESIVRSSSSSVKDGVAFAVCPAWEPLFRCSPASVAWFWADILEGVEAVVVPVGWIVVERF